MISRFLFRSRLAILGSATVIASSTLFGQIEMSLIGVCQAEFSVLSNALHSADGLTTFTESLASPLPGSTGLNFAPAASSASSADGPSPRANGLSFLRVAVPGVHPFDSSRGISTEPWRSIEVSDVEEGRRGGVNAFGTDLDAPPSAAAVLYGRIDYQRLLDQLREEARLFEEDEFALKSELSAILARLDAALNPQVGPDIPGSLELKSSTSTKPDLLQSTVNTKPTSARLRSKKPVQRWRSRRIHRRMTPYFCQNAKPFIKAGNL